MKKKRNQFEERKVAEVTLDLDNFDLIEPNQFELDKECRIQPKLVFAYLKEKAETSFRIDGLKAEIKAANAELKRVTARLDTRIRRYPKKYKMEKMSEAAIANTIILQPSYKDAEQEVWRIEKLLYEAEHYRNLLEAAAKALDNRRSSIENLVKLHGQSYFATPKIDGDNKDMMADMKMKRNARNRKR